MRTNRSVPTPRFRSRFVPIAALALAGCTQSFPTSYQAGQGLTAVSPPRSQSIAIARFEDKRSFAQRNDPKAASYVGVQSPWMFGLTHKGKAYIPVSELVQDLFVTEFQAVGLKAVAADLTSADPGALQEAALAARTDYALGGQILVFEFANDAGVWTVTSRRSVTMTITLMPARGEAAFRNATITSSDAENEGMAVLHTTNVSKLMNGTFRNVLNQAIAAVAEKLAMLPSRIEVRVAGSGRAHRFRACTFAEAS